MAAMVNIASGIGINTAVVTAGTGAALVAPAKALTAASIGNTGNDRFCGRCLGGTNSLVCADPTTAAVVADLTGVVLPLQSICSKFIFKFDVHLRMSEASKNRLLSDFYLIMVFSH